MAEDWLTSHLSGVTDGVVTTAIWAVGVTLIHSGHRLLAISYRVPPLVKAYIAIVIFLSGLLFIPPQQSWLIRTGIYLIGGGVLAFILRSILKGYDDVGIAAAYYSARYGVSFKRSLRLAQRSLDFLGIGASKLTENKEEFEAAMKRCAVGGKTVRLLLSPPDNPLLEALAVRNSTNANLYSRNVLDSLRRIARLQADHQLDIQVRFYAHQGGKDLQIFRLMFLDESTCLWSWTVWDSDRGQNNPQVVLRNHAKDGSERSAYHAFQDYFDRLWDDLSTVKADLSTYRDVQE